MNIHWIELLFVFVMVSCIVGYIAYEEHGKKIPNEKQETYLVERPEPVCTNYVHIQPWNVHKKICRVKTITIEEKHQIYITDECPPQILHHPNCKFCRYKLNKEDKNDL